MGENVQNTLIDIDDAEDNEYKDDANIIEDGKEDNEDENKDGGWIWRWKKDKDN